MKVEEYIHFECEISAEDFYIKSNYLGSVYKILNVK